MMKYFLLIGITASLFAADHVATKSGELPFGEAEGGTHQYRQASLTAPVQWRGLAAEADMRYAEEDTIGYVGGSEIFRIGKYAKVIPGAGYMFGQHEPGGFAAKVHGGVEFRWFVAEASYLQGFRKSFEAHRDNFVDTKVGIRIPAWNKDKAELGFVPYERVAHLEALEKSWGGWVMIPVSKRFGLTFKALNTSYRVGIVLRSPPEE